METIYFILKLIVALILYAQGASILYESGKDEVSIKKIIACSAVFISCTILFAMTFGR